MNQSGLKILFLYGTASLAIKVVYRERLLSCMTKPHFLVTGAKKRIHVATKQSMRVSLQL